MIISLPLNDYEAANLLSLLDAQWNEAQRPNKEGVKRLLEEFNTGDWVGEIPYTLAKAMLTAGPVFLDCQPHPIWQENTMPTTREMVARCGVGVQCPHCGNPLVEKKLEK